MTTKRLVRLTEGVIFVVLLVCLSGCVTAATVARAKGYKEVNEKGETVVEKKPAPALYALTPLTVPADVVIFPFWVLWGWGRIAVGLPPPY
jgi:hypothetical protein